MFPPDYPGLVNGQKTDEIVSALLQIFTRESGEPLRRNFINRFALERHLFDLATAIRSVEKPAAK